jgi:hypothetical protein
VVVFYGILFAISIVITSLVVYDRYKKSSANHKYTVTLKPKETIHTAERLSNIHITVRSTRPTAWHTLPGFPKSEFPETKTAGSTLMGPVYLRRDRIHAFTNISDSPSEIEISWSGDAVRFSEPRIYPNTRKLFK